MQNKLSIIVGGSGQIGICLAQLLLKKNYKVVITTRNILRAKKKISIKDKKLIYFKLNVLNKKEIFNLFQKFKASYIFYFAGQSSPFRSFKKKKITFLSNVQGCENFLKIIEKLNINIKFINASSSEIFSKTNEKKTITSEKKPISPYGVAKLASFNKTKYFRNNKNIKAYNAIFYNTESYYRDNFFLIPKICIAAINAHKFNTKTSFGNLNIVREWNWGDEQVKYLLKFLKKKPQDFILSNGKFYSAKEMLDFAFQYFNLDYRLYIKKKSKLFRKKDFKIRKSNFKSCLLRNNLSRKSLIYGKNLVHKLIKYYLNEKKY